MHAHTLTEYKVLSRMEEGAADIVVVAPARVYLPSFGIYTQTSLDPRPIIRRGFEAITNVHVKHISTDRLNESKLHHT